MPSETSVFEAAIHTILYIRQIYPVVLFHQVRKYGSTIWQCRADPVCEYIGKVASCIEEELHKGSVRRVFVAVREDTAQGTPLERFVFDIDSLLRRQDLPQDGADFIPSAGQGIAPADLDDLLRACMVKLNVSSSYLKPIPSGTPLTFAVLLEVEEGFAAPASKAAQAGDAPAEWIPAAQRDAMEDDGTGPGRGRIPPRPDSTISPITGVRLGVIGLDLQVEELAEKFMEAETDPETSGEVRMHPLPDRKGKGRA
ncbi:hypothetical protein JCM8202_003247 [Rhodotorula sphaerocarpa]